MIVAGGSGSRMKAKIPKQFLLLGDRPLLMQTISVFRNFDPQITIIVVLPADHISNWKKLQEQYNFDVSHQIVIGGNTRYDSVKNGLDKIPNTGIVAIHDGARPLVSADILDRTFSSASNEGNGIAAVPLKDSLRVLDGESNSAMDREHFRIIQTPQAFQTDLIKAAYKNVTGSSFTDDASVAEANGAKIHLVTGSYDNIKITSPEDLILANTLFAQKG